MIESDAHTSAPQVEDSTLPTDDDSGSMFTGMEGTISSGDLDLADQPQTDMTLTVQFAVDDVTGSNTIATIVTDSGDMSIVVNDGRVSGHFAGASTANIPVEVRVQLPAARCAVVCGVTSRVPLLSACKRLCSYFYQHIYSN